MLQDASGAYGFEDLAVFKLAYKLAMEVFELTKRFPKDERFALVDQLRRSSRSVAGNIAEAYRKKRYPAAFVNKLTDADAEAAETQVSLMFSHDCGYITTEDRNRLLNGYREVGRMLGGMMARPYRFCHR